MSHLGGTRWNMPSSLQLATPSGFSQENVREKRGCGSIHEGQRCGWMRTRVCGDLGPSGTTGGAAGGRRSKSSALTSSVVSSLLAQPMGHAHAGGVMRAQPPSGRASLSSNVPAGATQPSSALPAQVLSVLCVVASSLPLPVPEVLPVPSLEVTLCEPAGGCWAAPALPRPSSPGPPGQGRGADWFLHGTISRGGRKRPLAFGASSRGPFVGVKADLTAGL